MSDSGIDRLLDTDDSDLIDAEMVLQQILADPALSQHVIRTEYDGREVMTGYFRVAFEAGQQRQVLHVPFSPPLGCIPEVQAQATDHPELRVRITDRQKFGIRLEVVLARPAESGLRALIEIIASEPG